MSQFLYIVILLACNVLVPLDVALGYIYSPEAYGWISKHLVIATWDDANKECRSQGAVLMSPIRKSHLNVMRTLIGNSSSFYIGTRSTFLPRRFESAEGIGLEDMPVTDLLAPLDPQNGQCLSMTQDAIRVVSCTSRLPYICYKELVGMDLNECGTIDQEYELNNVTGSCYKYHQKSISWADAYHTCLSENAYLVIVNDKTEALELVKIMTNKGIWVFVGLREWGGHGEWISVHNHPIKEIYNEWYPNRRPSNPSNVASINPTEGKLLEWGESDVYYFICEKDPTNIRFPVIEHQQNENY